MLPFERVLALVPLTEFCALWAHHYIHQKTQLIIMRQKYHGGYTIQNVKKSHNAHWNLPIYILLERNHVTSIIAVGCS